MVAQKSELRPQIRSDFALTAGSRERNFWMQRQGAKNRHQNARAPTETKIRELSGEIPAETPYLASYRKRPVCGDWVVGAPGLEPGTR
jgi:hypothetical protein